MAVLPSSRHPVLPFFLAPFFSASRHFSSILPRPFFVEAQCTSFPIPPLPLSGAPRFPACADSRSVRRRGEQFQLLGYACSSVVGFSRRSPAPHFTPRNHPFDGRGAQGRGVRLLAPVNRDCSCATWRPTFCPLLSGFPEDFIVHARHPISVAAEAPPVPHLFSSITFAPRCLPNPACICAFCLFPVAFEAAGPVSVGFS